MLWVGIAGFQSLESEGHPFFRLSSKRLAFPDLGMRLLSSSHPKIIRAGKVVEAVKIVLRKPLYEPVNSTGLLRP